MNKIFFILFCLILIELDAQIDFEKHIESIKKEVFFSEDSIGKFNVNERTVEYALAYLVKNNIQKKYITNRKLLNKINLKKYRRNESIHYYGVLNNGKQIELKIKFKKFYKKNHKVIENKILESIDGLIPYGAFYGLPLYEIKSFSLTVNNRKIKIDSSVYRKFYGMFEGRRKTLPIELYSSFDGSFIFVYIDAGNAADSYFAKLIFDNNKYLTEIVATYEELLNWRKFGNSNFLGF